MKTLKIKVPIWKDRSIGINSKYLQEREFFIKITYKNIEDELIYPDKYIMTGEKLKKYPKQQVKGAILYLVPIKDLELSAEEKLL